MGCLDRRGGRVEDDTLDLPLEKGSVNFNGHHQQGDELMTDES